MSEPHWVEMADGSWPGLLFDRTFAFNKGRIDKMGMAHVEPAVTVTGRSGQRVFPVALSHVGSGERGAFSAFVLGQKDVTRRYSLTAIGRVIDALSEATRRGRVVDSGTHGSEITLEEDCEPLESMRDRPHLRLPALRARTPVPHKAPPSPLPIPSPTKRRFKK